MRIHVIEPLAISQNKITEITERFKTKGHIIKFYPDRNENPDEIIKRSLGAQIIVFGNLPFPSQCVEALPDLKLVAVAFTGVDHVAVQTCREKGISVCNASGYSTINVAELTVGLMIDVLRNVTRLDPVTRKGGTKDGLVGFDLSGKTVGIIGTGAIGMQVAKLLKGFDCKILGFNKGKKTAAPELGIEYTSLDELLIQSDIVTLHCPLNETTRGLIGDTQFSMMKNSAYIINCARGPVIDTKALVTALKTGKIAGAGIDVFDTEPPLQTDYELLKLENAILTPHIAFATKEAFLRRADIVTDNIFCWIDGKPKSLIV
ncbi:MAG: NAD(P)-dependent oxidoreductase [Spirochaetaceae bacterium]|nr:NAD(P)-dependent oxidoreductase [Spirochaetaceae bacterium]